MRSIYLWPGFLAALALFGCLPASTSPMDGSVTDTGGAVTYTRDVQPILMVKCAPCHTGSGLGNHNIGTTYADALKPVQSSDSLGCWNDPDDTTHTMPKKVGECAQILILNGRMPNGAGCANNPPLEPTMCLTDAEKAVIAAWVAAGLPQ
jgi:hypothetical protein